MAWRAAAAIAGATTWRKARERPGRRGDADTDGRDAGERAYCDKDAGVRGVCGDAAGVMRGEGVGDLDEGGGGGARMTMPRPLETPVMVWRNPRNHHQ